MKNYENCQRGPWQKGNWYNLWLLKSEEAAEKIIDELVIAKGRKSQDPCQNCLETGACCVSFNLLTSVTTRGFCGPPKWGKLRVHLLSPSHFKLAGHLHDVAKVASKKINYYLILKICNPELGPRRWLFRLTFSLYCSASALRNFYPLKKVTADKKTKF